MAVVIDRTSAQTPPHSGGETGGEPGGAASPGAPARPPQGRELYAAIDLGTNNCRLLIARREGEGFKVVDAFSRTVRLGEGLAARGALSEAAIERTVAALRVCAGKIKRTGVRHVKAIATAACRGASNAAAFLRRIHEETGLNIEIVTAGEEARLCAQGCAPLSDPSCEDVVVFDIGGGSTELIWLRRVPALSNVRPRMAAWTSVPLGVVSLAENFPRGHLHPSDYAAMEHLADQAFETALTESGFSGPAAGPSLHLLGTSGTVTTLAGVHLDLPRYDRNRIDGLWLEVEHAKHVLDRLVGQEFDARAAHPCIGADRADLILPGCAIFSAILRRFPARRLRVADRGLREGILLTLMRKVEKDRHRRRKGRREQRSGTHE